MEDATKMKKLFFVGLLAVVGLMWVFSALGASGDLTIDAKNIVFSDTSPMEGDAIAITAVVRNEGDADIPEDIDVRFMEGDPKKGALQIASDAIIMGLKAGASATVDVKWRAAAGTTKIYVIADPDNAIKESNEDNNTAIKLIKARRWRGRKVTDADIKESIKKGLTWLRSQQGEFYVTCPNGHDNFLYSALAYGKCVICGASLKGIEPKRAPVQNMPGGWMPEIGPGMTSLVLAVLLYAGVDESDPAVVKGIDHLLHKAPVTWYDWTDPYDFAVGILALTATGDKEKYMDLVEYATKRLESMQTKDGGWGYGTVADAAHLQYVMMGLYAAKQWGVDIKPDTWTRAAVWLTSMQQPDGGWNYYSSGSGPFAASSYGSMTATAVMGLKAAGVSPDSKAIQDGIKWLEKYYSITRNPGSFYWHYYYLLALQRAMDMPPAMEKLGGHDWYHEIASFLVSKQQKDGSWIAATPIYTTGNVGKAPQIADWGRNRGDLLATSFAMLFLLKAMPKPSAPDVGLAPGDIGFSEAEPAEGTEVTITASILNRGSIALKDLEVSFYDGPPDSGGVPIGTAQVSSLPPGARGTAAVVWKAKGAGEHKIYAVIDPANHIREFNEENNIAFGHIRVGGESAPVIPAMVKISDGVYKLGKVDLDLNKKTVTIYGKSNMSYGLIELLACTKIGKTHESALVMDVQPIHLQTALILLGLNYGGNLRYQGDPRTPQGDRVRIWVEWEKDGQSERHRAEELVYNRATQTPMKRTDWVFSGSRTNSNGVFMAQAVGTLITTFHDPDSIIDNPLPGGSDDTVYIVNTKVAPPKGTPVKMIITPAKSEEASLIKNG